MDSIEVTARCEYISDYDKFVCNLENHVTFSMCKHNTLQRINEDFTGQKMVSLENYLIAKAFFGNYIYASCLTYRTKPCSKLEYNKIKTKNTKLLSIDSCTYLHICNIFPIMIGSILDLVFSENVNCVPTRINLNQHNTMCDEIRKNKKLIEEEDLRDFLNTNVYYVLFQLKLKPKLAGHFIVNGEIVVIPYILENNRENIHAFNNNATQTSNWRFFLYNNENRGYKFELNSENNAFTFRNKNGQIFQENDNFETEIDFSTEFNFRNEHIFLDGKCIKKVLSTLLSNSFNIDDLRNKIILPAVDLLYRLVLFARKQPKIGINILSSGNFAKLISTKLSYVSRVNKSNSATLKTVNVSNLYRRPLANQIGTCDLMFNVIKLTQELVKVKKKVPDNTRGFICPYDIYPNIKNFAKILNLVYDVKFPSFTTLFEIDNLFDYLLNNKLIQHNGNENNFIANDNRLQILIKLLPTPYVLTVSFEQFFSKLKHYNTHFEVRKFDNFICLNNILGMPLKPYQNILLSPFELNKLFPECFESSNFLETSITGTLFKKYQNYESHERSIISAGFVRNKCTVSSNYPLFLLTNEVFSIFFNQLPVSPKLAKQKCFQINDDGSVLLNVLISGIPEVNEDAFVLDSNINFNAIMTKKFNYEFELKSAIRILLTDEKACANFFLNSLGERELLIIHICTIYSDEDISLPLFGKIVCIKKENHVYDFYKFLDDASLMNVADLESLKVSIDVECNVVKDTNVYKLEILLSLVYQTTFYDGIKLANMCGSKGLCFFKDLSIMKTVGGKTPDLIVSLYGIIGRHVTSQLVEMGENGFENVFLNGKKEGIMAKAKFFILKNSASELKINGLIKVDNLTSNGFNNNALSASLYTLLQDSLDKNEKFQPFPKINRNILELYKVQKLNIEVNCGMNTNDTNLETTQKNNIQTKYIELQKIKNLKSLILLATNLENKKNKRKIERIQKRENKLLVSTQL